MHRFVQRYGKDNFLDFIIFYPGYQRDLDSLDGLDCMRHLVSGRPRAAKARLRVSQLGTKGLVSYHREKERDVMEKLLSDYIYI